MIKIRLGWRKRSTSVYGDEKFDKKIKSKYVTMILCIIGIFLTAFRIYRKDKKRSELDGSLEGSSHSDLDAIKDASDKSSEDSESPVPHPSNNTPPNSSPLDASSENTIHNVSSPSSPIRKDSDKKKKEKEKEKEKEKKKK